jgi:hypothetical protein
MSAAPVGTSSHGSWLMALEASPTMLPQLGPWLSGRVRPRNERPLSASSAIAQNNDVCTMIGPEMRGSTWRRRIAGVLSPDSRAAFT